MKSRLPPCPRSWFHRADTENSGHSHFTLPLLCFHGLRPCPTETELPCWASCVDRSTVYRLAACEADPSIHAAYIRNAYVSFTLAYFPTNNRRESVRLCRVDWRPLTIHTNDHPNTPLELLGDVPGTHHHTFKLNRSTTGAPLKALPIAEPIEPDYASFKELVDGVGAMFRITNAGSALSSPWPEDLFGQ